MAQSPARKCQLVSGLLPRIGTISMVSRPQLDILGQFKRRQTRKHRMLPLEHNEKIKKFQLHPPHYFVRMSEPSQFEQHIGELLYQALKNDTALVGALFFFFFFFGTLTRLLCFSRWLLLPNRSNASKKNRPL